MTETETIDLGKRLSIYTEVERERLAQDKEHGGPDHDDQHTTHDWIAFIAVFVGTAVKGSRWEFSNRRFRASMLKIAALAVAAVEWCDRRLAKGEDHP